jgi:hypothetical protein
MQPSSPTLLPMGEGRARFPSPVGEGRGEVLRCTTGLLERRRFDAEDGTAIQSDGTLQAVLVRDSFPIKYSITELAHSIDEAIIS